MCVGLCVYMCMGMCKCLCMYKYMKSSESVSRSGVSDSGISWTVAHQALLSMEFSRKEHCSG